MADLGRAIAILLVAASMAAAQEGGSKAAAAPSGATPTAHVDYRYAAWEDEPEDPGPSRWVFLPEDDIFRPLLADPKAPRFSLAYRRVHFTGVGVPTEKQGKTIDAGIAGLGGTFGLIGLRHAFGADGIELSAFGAVFSQFNLNAALTDLINTDFIVGPQVTVRKSFFSARVRVYHQSSHLGDKFLLNNPDVDKVNLSLEYADALLSVDTRWLRLYAGGGGIVHTHPELPRGLAEWGAELRGPDFPSLALADASCVPVFGADFKSFEAQGWQVTTSLAGGVEWASKSSTRRIRLLAVYLRGFLPFGQFFTTEKVENFGVMMQFEF